MSTQTSSFGVSKRESHDSSSYYARKVMDIVEDVKSMPCAPSPESIDALFCQSAVDMHQVADSSVALCVTSPPYFVGKEYDEDGTIEEYLDKTLRPALADVYRTLEPGGRLAINVSGLGKRPYYNFPNITDQICLDLGYLPRGEVIWQKGEGANGSCAWGSWDSAVNPVVRDLHEKVLLYSKARYDRHPSRRGPKREDGEAFMRDTLSIWKINPESAKRVKHPAPFPVELPKRLIEMYTFPGELVIDPFVGSGSTAIAAKQTGRHYVGYDISEEYLATARKRLES